MRPEINDDIDIVEIIENEYIVIHYHPIVCIRKKVIIGLEALCRGIYNNTIVSPVLLFELAKREGLVVELDRLCRRKATEKFAKFITSNPEYSNLILFINFEASIIDQGVVGSKQFFNMVNKFNLNPNKIAIEIVESEVHDTKALKQFIDTYREYGFILALDDLGKGHSNLSRLDIVRPDILKIDLSIVRNIDKEFYKQEIMRSLVNLSKKVGAVVIAEGIECEEEALTSLSFGIDMLQGYYFTRPSEIESLLSLDIDDKNVAIAERMKDYVMDNIRRENALRQEYDIIVNKMVFELSISNVEEFEEKMKRLVGLHNKIECIYVLNDAGIQISNTVCNQSKISTNKLSIFEPSTKGTDHSIKNYYYLTLGSPTGMYISEPYVSMASGNLCITISTMFMDTDSNRYILCIDANYIYV